MTLKKAIRLLETEYEEAKRLAFVHNPLAYALYRVWRMADADQPRKAVRSDGKVY